MPRRSAPPPTPALCASQALGTAPAPAVCGPSKWPPCSARATACFGRIQRKPSSKQRITSVAETERNSASAITKYPIASAGSLRRLWLARPLSRRAAFTARIGRKDLGNHTDAEIVGQSRPACQNRFFPSHGASSAGKPGCTSIEKNSSKLTVLPLDRNKSSPLTAVRMAVCTSVDRRMSNLRIDGQELLRSHKAGMVSSLGRPMNQFESGRAYRILPPAIARHIAFSPASRIRFPVRLQPSSGSPCGRLL